MTHVTLYTHATKAHDVVRNDAEGVKRGEQRRCESDDNDDEGDATTILSYHTEVWSILRH